MLLAHLEHQNKEQLQCTLARLENENRSASKTGQKCVFRECGAVSVAPVFLFYKNLAKMVFVFLRKVQ